MLPRYLQNRNPSVKECSLALFLGAFGFGGFGRDHRVAVFHNWLANLNCAFVAIFSFPVTHQTKRINWLALQNRTGRMPLLVGNGVFRQSDRFHNSKKGGAPNRMRPVSLQPYVVNASSIALNDCA